MSTSQNVFTVVSGMDEVHIGMGSVLNILHTYGVWVLQGIAEEIFLLDIAGQVVFLVDIVLQFFVAYKDSQTYNMIYKRTPIALRIIKLIAVELYCTHTAACIFYYLATTLPAEQEGYTWIGSLKLGDCSYLHFRQIDLWKRYTTSLYFAIVTMSTVGQPRRHLLTTGWSAFINKKKLVSGDAVLFLS